MNYKIIYESISKQIRERYLSEASQSSIEPLPLSFPVDDVDDEITPTKTDPTAPFSPSGKPNPHFGNPNFHQFPISPEGIPIQVWDFIPSPPPGSFQLFGWSGQRYNPIGQPVPYNPGVGFKLPNQDIPLVVPNLGPGGWQSFPLGLENPIFGPNFPPNPGGLNWPPGFNPNFWQQGDHFVIPPISPVKPNYPTVAPGVNDPYQPTNPSLPPIFRPGMFPGGIAPYRPHDPNYDPQNPFAKPGIPVVTDPSRPLGPPRPPRKPSDIFYGLD
jgi:hypothetical protein